MRRGPRPCRQGASEVYGPQNAATRCSYRARRRCVGRIGDSLVPSGTRAVAPPGRGDRAGRSATTRGTSAKAEADAAMIASLTGTLTVRDANRIVVETGGV